VIKNIVSCGCSWVDGSGCYFRHKEKLSALFAKKYNAEDINLAKEGGSNDRSVRKITNWIVGNKDKLDETLFLIGVTEPQRFEIWSPGPVSVKPIDISDNTDEESVNLTFSTKHPPFTKVKGRYYRIDCLIQDTMGVWIKESIERTLRELFLLTALFEKYNCKYLIFDSMDNIKKITRRKNKYFDVVYNNKNYYSEESWMDFCSPRGKGFLAAEDVRMVIREGEDYSPDWGHPSAKGNQKWFEVLTNYAEENKLW
jgi:hypothetical protein